MTDIKTEIAREKALADYAGEDRIVTSQEMRQIIERDHKEDDIVHTGFRQLDQIIGGLRYGELVTVSGATGEGKTTLCQSWTKFMANDGTGCVWFSYEVIPQYFLDAFGHFLPLFYMPAVLKESSLPWIEQRVIEAKLKHECRVVFIDHLHYLIDMKGRHNMSLEIGFVMRSLKKMAIRHRVVVVLIAHLSKISPESEPDTRDLRDSSFIGQESDSVIIVWRAPEGNVGTMKVAKNRKFGTRAKIGIVKRGWFFEEVSSERA